MREPTPLAQATDLADIRLLCCDVDGVMTDGGLYYTDAGRHMVRFHVLDGMGLIRLQRAGVKTAFISQSRNDYINVRGADIGVDYCHTGIHDKSVTMHEIAAAEGLEMSQIAHIADDVNDISLLKIVGFPITVPNGMPEVKSLARYVTAKSGGDGAVRELCDAIIAART